MAYVLTWLAPALDGVLIMLLAVVLWRLRQDPTAAWRAREETLREIFEGLRTTVAQAEGLARELDSRLGEHQTELRTLMRTSAEAVARAAAAPARPRDRERDPLTDAPSATGRLGGHDTDGPPANARDDARDPLAEARRLAAAGLGIDEIVRRVAVSPAEARVLAGLGERARRAPAANARAGERQR